MVRRALTGVFVVALAVPAAADVVITNQTSGKALGRAGEGQAVTSIKGLKLRMDQRIGDRDVSTIFDLEAQQFISLNHGKKEAEVYDLAKLRADIEKGLTTGQGAVAFKPNGQTKQVAGYTCTGYDLSIAVPSSMGEGMDFTVTMAGPVFLAKGAPGSTDYSNFYAAAAERGFFFTDAKAARASAGQTKAFTELYRQIAAAKAVPCTVEVTMKVEGGGPLGGMMGKMMGGGFGSTLQTAVAGPLGDDRFQPPAGYKVKKAS